MVNYWGSFQGGASAVYHLEADGTDSSGSGNSMGVSNGTVTYSTKGPFGNCGYFGGGASLKCNYAASWYPTSFTVGLWMNAYDTSTAGHMVGNFGYNGGSYYGWTLRADGSGVLRLYIGDGGGGEGTNNGTANSTYAAGTWCHVICTYNGTNTSVIYKNGVAVSTKSDHSTIGNNTSACAPRLGCRTIYSGDDRYYKGYLDNVWLIKGTVYSANDVKRSYAWALGKSWV
jgi:hypothetical protein